MSVWEAGKEKVGGVLSSCRKWGVAELRDSRRCSLRPVPPRFLLKSRGEAGEAGSGTVSMR